MKFKSIFMSKTLLLTVVLSFSGITASAASDLSCEFVAPIWQSYLTRHVNYSEPSKNLENRTIKQLVRKLDSSKIYLLEKDVAQIQRMLTNILPKTSNKKCGDIEKAQKLYIKRMEERVKFAKSYLGKKYKFDNKTKLFLDPKKRKRSKTTKQAHEFLKKYIHFQISNYLMTDEPLEKAKEYVIRSYERNLKRVKDMEKDDLWSMFIDSYARGLDPHSSYFSKDALEDFEIQMRLSLEGIGASLSFRDGFTVIEQLIAGGAAYNSGKLKPKDKIVAVAQGKDGKFLNVIEMPLRDVVRKIRGKKGSIVRLTIARKEADQTKRFVVSLTRDKIKLEDDAASVTFHKRTIKGKESKVALVNLPSFYADSRMSGRTASRDLKKILKIVKKEKANAMVFDLSTNGGGSLDDAVKVAGLFFARGNVVKQSHRDPRQPELALADDDKSVDYAGPLVILTSRISASASEIVSGTLKEYKRAVILGGDHTFGKGTVQSVEPLKRGELGAIKTTVGMFFTAGGKSTQLRGVKAHITLPSALNTDEVGEGTLDYALPPKSIKPFLSAEAYVTSGPSSWKIIEPALIEELKSRSKSRVAKNKDFIKIKEDLAKAKKKQGKPILLADLMKKRSDLKKEKKEKGEDENKVLTAEEKKAKYLERPEVKEAINVAFDMYEVSSRQKLKLGATDGAKKPASKAKN